MQSYAAAAAFPIAVSKSSASKAQGNFHSRLLNKGADRSQNSQIRKGLGEEGYSVSVEGCDHLQNVCIWL
jgi:hypothetical protein